ncbi:related to phenol 2-monooxygenase [Cephalotrichum gorgonifer]|uniref:Related to phenol 2-monooxygenase n=1 Tax=Cephalotrichum gorgonifer TaxID=2041049 RepID=A0AAE8MYR1_9PEZI|nr:related to phenol 2-monooxygenase [Cephalotrichum gorgonifer]
MAGEEYARTYSWGHNPKRKGDYELASPCNPVDLPQTLLEPILVRRAAQSGFKVRFNTSLESFTKDPKTKLITASVRDKVSNLEYKIRAKYLLGADGAQSRVMKQLGIPLIRKPGQGVAINVLVKADLSHLVASRKGNLHWIIQPDCEHPEFGYMGLIRMVKAWDEWMFILFPDQDWDSSVQPTEEQYLKRVRELIGDDTPAEILNVSKWFINEIVAENYSVGDSIFCLGDAVHRHPPFNGLGSNTCIQDAFNLAWKLAYVHRGLASPSLLDTYSVERQPVGVEIIARANQAFRDHVHVWDALGALPPDISERRKMFRELSEYSTEGKKRRRALRKAINGVGHEFHGLGIEMGQHYSGRAIYGGDEKERFSPPGRAASDPVYYYEPNTYPGSRLPHVWLNKAVPTTPTSTIDIAGHGRFVLFTGIGGDAWKAAVKRISADMGVPIEAHSIGYRQDWEDVYFDWESLCGVDESGAVLVRPDRFVAWRAHEVLGSDDVCTKRLTQVMRSVLGFPGA